MVRLKDFRHELCNEFGKEKIVDITIDRETMRANKGIIDLGAIQVSADGIELEGVTVRAEKSETQFSLDKRIFNVGKDLQIKEVVPKIFLTTCLQLLLIWKER